MLKFLQAAGRAWDRVELFVGGLFLTLSVFIIVAEIALRSLFSTSMVGADEVASFAVIWSVFFTASLAVKRNIHVRIDVIFTLVPASVGRWIDMAGTLLSAVFTLYLSYAGWALVQESLMLGEVTMTMLHLPLWIPQSIVPIGGALLSMRLLQRLAHLWRDPSAYSAAPPIEA